MSEALGDEGFTPPTSGTAQDWVLVLDDKSKKYFTPGAAAASPSPGTELAGSVVGERHGRREDDPVSVVSADGRAGGAEGAADPVPARDGRAGDGQHQADEWLQGGW